MLLIFHIKLILQFWSVLFLYVNFQPFSNKFQTVPDCKSLVAAKVLIFMNNVACKEMILKLYSSLRWAHIIPFNTASLDIYI